MTDQRRKKLTPEDQTGPLSWELELDNVDYFDTKRVLITLSGPVVVDENLKITLKSGYGAAWDAVLKDVSVFGAQSIIIEDVNNLTLGDKLLLEWDNTGGLTMNAWAILERSKQNTSGLLSTGTVLINGIVVSEPLEIKGFNTSTGALDVMEQNAVSLHFTDPVTVPIGPITAGVPDVSVRIDMEGYRGCVAALFKTGGDRTTIWKMDSAPDGSLPGSSWLDTTQYGWSSATVLGAAPYSADGMLYSVNKFRPPGHRFNVDTAADGTTNNTYNCVYSLWY